MAEQIEIKVDLKESLAKTINATQRLNLDEGQKQRLEKYSKGAQWGLDNKDLELFKTNFNKLVGLFKEAAAATGEVSKTIKELTDRQTLLNREINNLKEKRATAESKLTKDGSRLTKAAAKEFAQGNQDAQKVVTSGDKTATRDQIVELQIALKQFLEQTGKTITRVTNEDLKQIQTTSGLTFKNRTSMFAAQRYVEAEKTYTSDIKNEISSFDDQITAKENAYTTLTDELTRMSQAAEGGSTSINALYEEIVKIANLVNTDTTKALAKQKLDAANRDAAPDLTAAPEVSKVAATSTGGLSKAFKQFTVYNLVLKAAKKALREAVQTVKELDKYLTEQAMVTGKTRQETYALVGQYQELALACGATTKEIAQVTTEYMKQGKSTAEALVLTEAAVKAAKVARVSVGDSVNYLTTALNGFRLEATEAMRVSDIFASVAAASATDYDELAIALSKVASQANLAGMSIEYTTALLTKGLETTREAPETMGTALKTIIARMREMSDYGETLEGDTDINNVESQLAYVGIALKNEQGELRSTEEVLDELGKKWDTLNKNQQAALAKALAGTRQQSRLIAMMDDYERVTELQEIAMRSAGATSAQASVYLEGMEAAINKIQVAWEKIVMTFTDSEAIIGIVNFLGDALGKIGELLSNPFFTGAAIAAIAIHMAKVIGLKLQEQHIARETEKIERKRALMESQQKLEQLKLARKQLEAGVSEVHNNAENLKLQLQLTKEARKRLNLKKAENGEITKEEAERLNKELDEEYNKEIERIDDQTKRHVESQKAILDAQIKTQSEIVKMNEDQMNSVQGLRSAWSGYVNSLKDIGSKVVSVIKNIAAVAKKATKPQQAASASTVPMVGWIISLIIEGSALLATIISAIAGFISLCISWHNDLQNSAENAAKKVNGLSNEIYTLNQTATSLDNVISKFDDLDDKVLKTSKDLEEMNSLLDSAGDSLSSEKDAKYNQETYKNLQDNASRRRYIELAAEYSRQEANKKRQEQLNIINGLSTAEKNRLLNDDTTNSAFLESQSAIRAIVNNKIYETVDALKELGTYTDEELKATEELTVAFMEETKALEALDYANNPEAVSKLVSELVKLDATSIFSDESKSITERVEAFREIQKALADDEAALEALNKAYSEWNTFSQMSDDLLDFIEATNLSIDQLNELYAGYSKLQKASIEITKDQYQKALEETMLDLDSNLSNFKDVVAMHFGDMLAEGDEFADQWNAIVSAIGDTFATGILDMGQNMEKFQNTINSFYEKSAQWAEMKESEKMAFIADNADLFAGEGGQEMLAAFESGDYNTIEAALRTQMEDRLKTQLAEVQRTLAVEEARVGEDRNEAYIASLREYEKYLLDGNKLYKASLDLRLEQEKNQLDKYKEYLEKQQEALTESLEKRKEAYEKYFDDINQEQEDADYEEDANRLITNISKLSSSTNADAMQKTAELEQELRDLEEERLKELRERAQEAVIENIDTTIEEINDKFDKLLESNQALLHAMQGDLNNPLELMTDMIMTKADDGLSALEMQQYIQDLQGTYGSVIGNDVFENMTVREDGDHLILNISGQEVVLGSNDQQSVYLAIMEALRAVGLK